MKTFKIKLNETVTGLTNTTWDPTGVVSGRAATEDQLAAAIDDNRVNIKGSLNNDNIQVTSDVDTHTWYVNTGEHINDLTNTTWDSSSITSGRAATEDQLLTATEQLPMIVRGGTTDQTTIAPGARKNFQFDVNDLPANYVIASYRQISISGVNFQSVFIQTFSTTGGGRKANISVFNGGTEEARVAISVAAICVKQL